MGNIDNNNLDKKLERAIKNTGIAFKKYFAKVHNYLGFSGWIILGLLILILFLVIHYQKKIDNLQSSQFLYYEMPSKISYNTNVFHDFDEYFKKQSKYFNDLFEAHEKLINKYRNVFNSDKWIVDTSKNSQQIYQKYYLYDGKIYSYKVNYNNGSVDGNLMINDNTKKDMLIKKIQNLGLGVSDSGMNISFFGKIDNINSLLNILD